MLEKSRNVVLFSMIPVSGQSKNRLVKAAGAESSGQRRNEKLHAAVAKSRFWSQNVKKTDGLGALFQALTSKNCTPLWREAHSPVKMLKNWRSRSTFWSSDVEKLHAAVARSTFTSPNVKKLTVSEHFLKFWCPKIARHCGEKRIHKSKCWKTDGLWGLFEVLVNESMQ